MGKLPKVSGVLPRPRQILSFTQTRTNQVAEGYAEGVPHPPGSTRSRPVKPLPVLETIFQLSAADPKLSPKEPTYRSQLASMRRQYYREALTNDYEKHMQILERQKKATEVQKQRAVLERRDLQKMQEDKLFTLPTIESYVKKYQSLPSASNNDRAAKKLLSRAVQFEHLARDFKQRERALYAMAKSSNKSILTMSELDKEIEKTFADGVDNSQPNYSSRSINYQIIQRLNGRSNHDDTDHTA
ncbi:uncharacterized protein V1518DRAFT_413583 [Limtongia smithiae]|uniref:uncharacterized protein n=1 Tax=Limtongia smithiae TaxID=1125753 RepID=UPI0034CEE50E